MADYESSAKPLMPLVPLSREKDASQLCNKFSAVKRRRTEMERQWALNLAFYKGNQYAFPNRKSGRLESLGVEEGDKPRWRVRLVSNQILPGVQGYVSLLTKTKPVINATPGTSSDKSLRAAQVADKLYEYWYQDFQLEDKCKEALIWSTLGGNGWLKVSWDAEAGKAMTFTIGPDGQPITDDALADLFKQQLQQYGIDPARADKTVYLGDIRVEVMPPFHVWVDPTAKSFEDARWAICQHNLSPSEIKTRWGVTLKADAVMADYDTVLPFSNAESKAEPTVKAVFIGYFLPGPENPKGRYVAFVDNPAEILYDGPWQFPLNMLPLVRFPGQRYPGRVEDEALVTHARPMQKELNRTLSQIVEHKNLTIKPQMMAPMGSMRQKATDEPGAIYEYNAVNGERPEWREMPQLQPYVFEHLRELQGRLDRLFGAAQVTRGEVPPNVEAGVAIDLLQETAVDQFAPVIQSYEAALCRLGKLCIGLAQEFYIEARLVKIKGEGGRLHVHKFMNADIDSGVDFYAEAGSGLPRTRAGKMMRIKSMMEMGLLQPWQALKYMDVADMQGARSKVLASEEKQARESDKLLNGEILNPEAVAMAMGAIQAGVNPETGEALSGNEQEIMAVLMHAAVAPAMSDNHAVHIDVLQSLLDSIEFERWPQDARQRAYDHFAQHMQAASQPPIPAPEAAKVGLTIHSSLGPSATSKILQASGIAVTPEEAMEAPLETVVMDSVDAPDAGEAGNNPFTPAEQAAAATKAAVEAASAMQKAHSAALTDREKLRGSKAQADGAVRRSQQTPKGA